MTRADHQPWSENPERPTRTADEMREACGRAIAFALALGQQPGDIAQAIRAAHRAGVPAVYVLAKPAFAPQAAEAVRTFGRKGKMLLQAIEYDPAAAIALTRDAGDFELFSQLPFGLLETMRVIAESSLDVYESVIALDAAQNRITADHLYELCEDARMHPDAEVVVAWIQQLRRLPCLITRSFLDRLEARDPQLLGGGTATTDARGGVGATRPAPFIRTRDHLFGEEKLAAPPAEPPAVSSFLDRVTLSALEAVRLARAASPGNLNNVDALLVQTAARAAALADAMTPEEAAELEWADAFGRCARQDFPLLNALEHRETLAYLDSAATAQRVNAALEAQRRFDEHENANVYRGAYELSGRSTIAFNEARKRLARFIGAQPEQVVYTTNATGGINLVAQAWGEHNVTSEDLIVCELAAHHSNFMPFLLLAQRAGARVECVPYDSAGRIDHAAYRALLEQRPKLVCLAHIGNVFGIEAPVAELAAEAHAVGARVLVDAAQSFPHAKIDVEQLGADWLAISAHKAYGPLGIGALWVSQTVFDEMDPLGGGGGVLSHIATDSYYLRPHAPQYEMGTPPIQQAIGWAAALDYLDELGMDNVRRHAATLSRHAVRGLQQLDGVNVLGDRTQADGQMGVVPFTVRSVAPGDVARFLGRLGVAVRSGGHCALPLHAALGMIGTGRISVGVYTTRDDIDAAITAVDLCRRAYE